MVREESKGLMKFYFVPMEGITGYVFHNAFHSCFPYSGEKWAAG